MVKFVPAWDKRTGQPLPNAVPKSWLDNDTFPHLTGTQQGAAAAQRTTPTPEKKKEA